jgi:hypothetical protein
MKRHQPNHALRKRATYGECLVLDELDRMADGWTSIYDERIPASAVRRAIRILEREFAILGERRGRCRGLT